MSSLGTRVVFYIKRLEGTLACGHLQTLSINRQYICCCFTLQSPQSPLALGVDRLIRQFLGEAPGLDMLY